MLSSDIDEVVEVLDCCADTLDTFHQDVVRLSVACCVIHTQGSCSIQTQASSTAVNLIEYHSLGSGLNLCIS